MNINFGFSPCPNDTFIFWAWVQQHLSTTLHIVPHLHDIQQLNRLALGDAALGLTKLSIATYLEPQVQKSYRLLSVGAALGRGCGPLVVSKEPWSSQNPTPLRLAIPGRNTTAYRLAQMALAPWVAEWVELRYDQILGAVQTGEVDAGVIIHESRFAYQDVGLLCAFDLGDWWERETGLPLPLGVMVARRDLEPELVAEVERNIRTSINLAQDMIDSSNEKQGSESLWSYLRLNAIELDDTTIRSHIELYVNEYSLDLGSQGRAAITEFEERASKVTARHRSL